MTWARIGCQAIDGLDEGVLKGDSKTRMLLATLDCLRVEWMKRGSYETA